MSTTLPKTVGVLALCSLLLIGVASCGGGAEVQSRVSTKTVGQELMDLKNAMDSGAMTKDEYEKERAKVLSR